MKGVTCGLTAWARLDGKDGEASEDLLQKLQVTPYRIHSLACKPLETARLQSSDASWFSWSRPPEPGEDPESYSAYTGTCSGHGGCP